VRQLRAGWAERLLAQANELGAQPAATERSLGEGAYDLAAEDRDGFGVVLGG
jgi:hypothetical protein